MNRIVLITGGSQGIGKATATKFRECGDTVLSFAMEIDEDFPEYSYVGDVSNEQDVIKVISDIQQKYGKLDVLVNNAGISVNGALELISTEAFQKIMDVNVKGAYLFTKHSLPLMRKGAKIINISSVSGVFASPFRSMYCFSKSALLMLSLSQRMELEGAGIDVCAICPGEVKTNFMKKRVRVVETNERYGDRVENAFAFMDKHDKGKRMKPEKIANVIVKQANRKKSKPFKIVGFGFKLIYLGIKICPISLVLKVTNNHMGGLKKVKGDKNHE